jgi:hypothetical protein
MRIALSIFIVFLVAFLVMAPPALAQNRGGRGQQPSATANLPFDPHDLSGNWFRTTPTQTFSSVPGAPGAPQGGWPEAPFTPAGKAQFEKNFPGYGPRASPARRNDPMGTCDPLGVPRIVNAEVGSSHDWWKIVVTPGAVYQFVEWHHDYRTIYTDGRQMPKPEVIQDEPHWNGYSIGHWDGNTFVVDSAGFDDRTWLDKFGYPHTDQMKLQERYRRIDHDTLELTMTLTDPEFYTKPWESDRKLFRLDGFPFPKPWDEQVYCVPSEEYKFNNLIRDNASKGVIK